MAETYYHYEETHDYYAAQQIENYISRHEKYIDFENLNEIKKYISRGTYIFLTTTPDYSLSWSINDVQEILKTIEKNRDYFCRIESIREKVDIESQEYYMEDVLLYAIKHSSHIHFY